MTIVADTVTPSEAAFTRYDKQLVAAGWTRIEERPRVGGFRSARIPCTQLEGGTCCQGVQGPALSVRAIALPGCVTEVRLLLRSGPVEDPCAGPGRPPGSRPLIPHLTAPPKSTLVPRASGGGSNQARAEAQLVTEQDLGSVVTHYARQLEQAGWKRCVEEGRGPHAWSTWTFAKDDTAGRHGTLFLSILQRPGLPLRSGPEALTERPEIVQLYELEVRTVWRAAGDAIFN